LGCHEHDNRLANKIVNAPYGYTPESVDVAKALLEHVRQEPVGCIGEDGVFSSAVNSSWFRWMLDQVARGEKSWPNAVTLLYAAPKPAVSESVPDDSSNVRA